jgi:hypothetical protein
MPRKSTDKKKGGILFLLVRLEAQNNPEAAESRRRARYAILSALNTAGYAPVRSDRLSYVRLQRNHLPGATDPVTIPYEWAGRLERSAWLSADAGPDPAYDAVCVLWLVENYYPKSSFQSFCLLRRALDEALVRSKQAPGHFAIVFSLGSTELERIIAEDAKLGSSECSEEVKAQWPVLCRLRDFFRVPYQEKPLSGVTLYVTQSTGSFVRSRKTNPQASVPMKSGLQLEYVIGTDELLAAALIDELRSRGVHPESGDSIAIIAEWDTEYGRTMHPVFRNAALRDPRTGAPVQCDPNKIHIHHYSYLRGLDGKVPMPKADKQADKGQGYADAPPKKEMRTAPTSAEPQGDSQVDYVRRLVERIQSDHREYKALGVVSSDFYDKFLLRQALRPGFPHAVFFTTDLDARLLPAGDYGFTRNVLIASHYGLQALLTSQ